MRARSLLFWLVVAGLLAPAVLLTVLRLAQPSAAWGVRGVSFAPLAVPLYAGALGLLLLRRLVGGRRGTALALLPLAGLAAHAWWLAPLYTGSNPPPAAGAEPVVVMTANLLVGEADGPTVVREASRRGVDLLALQEVTDPVLAQMEESGLDELFPYRAGESGSRVEGTMLLSRTPVDDVVPVATELTGFSATVEIGDDPWSVVVVHPLPPIGSATAWRQDHRAVLDAAREVDADLVVGDLNAVPDHEPVQALADAGWRDVVELLDGGWQPTWPADGTEPVTGLPAPRLVQIDHVLVGRRVAAVSVDRVTVPDSDHTAVVAEVARK